MFLVYKFTIGGVKRSLFKGRKLPNIKNITPCNTFHDNNIHHVLKSSNFVNVRPPEQMLVSSPELKRNT